MTIAKNLLLALIVGSLSFALNAAEPEPAPTPPGDQPVELEVPRTETGTREAQAPSGSYDNVILHFGQDSYLPAGSRAAGVIAIGGSASSDGQVWEGVLSILGNTRVGGPTYSAVAVFGNTSVDNKVHENAVAVFGDVELGPHAEVVGDVIAVGGVIKRDPAAIVRGSSREISFPIAIGHLDWLRPWLQHCLLLGRPLALEPGISWAWTLAFGFLALYVLIALLYPESVTRCVDTLETRPGHSVLASLLTMFAPPIVTVALALTVIGAVLIPFVWIVLFCAGIFGKVVILGALGRRMTRYIAAGPLSHIAFPVFLGGLMLIAVYLVPVLGFIMYKLTGIIGLGVVMYTLLLALKAYREQTALPMMAAPTGGPMLTMSDESLSSGEPQPANSSAAPTAASVISPALPKAGFWIRMAALFVDGVIIGIALSALHDASDGWLLMLATYGAVMWKLKGTTIGGILCNLQVVRSDGRELDWATAIVRALSCFLSLVGIGLGFLWIVFDDNRQAWHDKIAGTVVVRVPKNISLV